MDSRKEVLSNLLNDKLLSQCIHCGLCLSVCPTYVETNLERSSPRGRLKLMKEYYTDENQLGKIFFDEMNYCLGCRACETACPAGVDYGIIHQNTKDILIQKSRLNIKKIFVKIFLNKILASPTKLKLFSKFLRLYQQSFFRKILYKTDLLKNISEKLFLLDQLSPEISKISSDELIDEFTLPINTKSYDVAFHVGCIMNVAFSDENLETINILKNSSCKITTPKDQFCCGALHAHNGELKKAKELAKKNIDLFEKYTFDFLISNSAGCGSFMKEYSDLLKDDNEYAIKAEKFSSKIKDITEFLSENNISLNLKVLKENITYHDACHLVHGQGIYNQPRELLKNFCNSNFTEMDNSTFCCGSAGIYNILRQKDSQVFLDKKMQNIGNTNADIVIMGNPGCIMQLKYGAKKSNLNIEVKHIVSVINQQIEA